LRTQHLPNNLHGFYAHARDAREKVDHLLLVIREAMGVELLADGWVLRRLLLVLVENPFERRAVAELAAGTVCLPLQSFEVPEGTENVTDWALDQFRAHYKKETRTKRVLTKGAIFHYVYAVLHDPSYREKYARHIVRKDCDLVGVQFLQVLVTQLGA
jgi:hypothetical protein